MGWGERGHEHPAAACCRMETAEECRHGTVNPPHALDVVCGRLDAAEATVHDLSARLELTEVDAGPALAWVPAGNAVRRFAAAVDELSTHDRDELRFLSAAIAEQLTQLDLDPHDGRTGAGALGVLLAAHDHTHLLADHGRLDPAIASGVARVLVSVAIAVACFAPEEVRNP